LTPRLFKTQVAVGVGSWRVRAWNQINRACARCCVYEYLKDEDYRLENIMPVLRATTDLVSPVPVEHLCLLTESRCAAQAALRVEQAQWFTASARSCNTSWEPSFCYLRK
jgi:hypothetical protein